MTSIESKSGVHTLTDQPIVRVARRKPVRRLLRQSPATILGELLVILVIATGIFGPVVAPFNPVKVEIGDRLEAPSSEHIMGTDELGRDVFSRVLHGARLTVIVIVFVLSIVLILGIPAGAIAGYAGGWFDEVLMRIGDLVLAFPPLVLAMALVVAMGPSLMTAMIAVALVRWPRYARLVRAQVLVTKHRPYVEAARASGATSFRIVVRHILPNSLDPVLVRATVDAGFVILTTASLSFIGLGAQQPEPEWGAMIATGRTYMIDNWWVGIYPGIAIMMAVTGFVLVGDEIRDLMDPVLRKR